MSTIFLVFMKRKACTPFHFRREVMALLSHANALDMAYTVKIGLQSIYMEAIP